MTFSDTSYKETLFSITEQDFDLVIIGGGVTGAGILLDAQSRGLKAVLFEKNDFASGTSSRSTKLIHGGLRYLKQKNVALVAEVGRERQIVAENAPHLVWKKRVFIPFYKGGSLGKLTAKAAMLLYEKLIRVENQDRHEMFKKSTVLERHPLINPDKLKGGVEYTEYATDDARLTIEIIKKAVEIGGVALNYTSVTGFGYDDNGKIDRIHILTRQGETSTVKTKGVISAAGPWADDILKLDREKMPQKLILTKGVHIVLPKSKLDISTAAYFDTKDKRMVFAIPKDDIVYVGTTDTFFEKASYEPGITKEDVSYLIDAVNHVFTNSQLDTSDIISGWSGLRPLIKEEGKKPSEISRKDEMFVTESGLLTIAGGKLTGYRKMADKVVSKYLEHLNRNIPCKSDQVILSGGEFSDVEVFVKEQLRVAHSIGLNENDAEVLIRRFGSNVNVLFDIFKEEGADESLPVHLGLSLKYCVRHEMVQTLSDFLIRRTGMLYFQISEVKRYYNSVAQELSKELNWTEEEFKENVRIFEIDIRNATIFN